MHHQLQDLVREDGTIHGLYVTKPAGSRPLALQVHLCREGFTNLNLSQSLEGKDFNAVYQRVIDQIAEYYEISQRSALYARLRDSKQHFLAKRGLLTRRVVTVYEQLVMPGVNDGEKQ